MILKLEAFATLTESQIRTQFAICHLPTRETPTNLHTRQLLIVEQALLCIEALIRKKKVKSY